MVTYQHLIDSGIPLSRFAAACGLAKITKWKTLGIPSKHLKTVVLILRLDRKKENKIFIKNKDLQNISEKLPLLAKNPLLNSSLQEKSDTLLANNMRIAVNHASRGLQPILKNHVFDSPESYIFDSDSVLFSLNSELKDSFIEYYFLSSLVRKIERRIEIKSYKKFRAAGYEEKPAPLRRVNASNCGRRVMPPKLQHKLYAENVPVGAVDILKSGDSVSFHGLMVCSDVWGCPCCARKISERRKRALSLLFDAHVGEYGHDSISATLYTIPHGLGDDLDDILTRLHAAYRFMVSSNEYKSLMDSLGCRGSSRAFEVTYGKNGFHPHFHVLHFFDGNIKEFKSFYFGCDVDFLGDSLFKIWTKTLIRFGFAVPDLRAFGCHAINTDKASLEEIAAYFGKTEKEPELQAHEMEYYFKKHRHKANDLKWTVQHEMTKWHLKKGSEFVYSMFDFLRGYVIAELSGDLESRDQFSELWLMYRRCFKGRRQLWTRHKDFKILDLLAAESELAQEDFIQEHEILASLDFEQWVLILRHNARASLLRVAKKGGSVAVFEFLDYLLSVSD